MEKQRLADLEKIEKEKLEKFEADETRRKEMILEQERLEAGILFL